MSDETYLILNVDGLVTNASVGKPRTPRKGSVVRRDDTLAEQGVWIGWLRGEDGTWTDPHTVEAREEPEADPAP